MTAEYKKAFLLKDDVFISIEKSLDDDIYLVYVDGWLLYHEDFIHDKSRDILAITTEKALVESNKKWWQIFKPRYSPFKATINLSRLDWISVSREDDISNRGHPTCTCLFARSKSCSKHYYSPFLFL